MTERTGPAPDLTLLADAERVDAVRTLVAAAGPSQRLEELAALAADLTGATLTTLSLVGEDTQVVAAVHGLDLQGEDRRVPVTESMCALTTVLDDVLELSDTAAHPWSRELPAVRSGLVGSYLGAPLRDSNGRVLGALGLHAGTARSWTAAERTAAVALARQAERELARLTQDGPAAGRAPSSAAGDVQLELAMAAAQMGAFSYDLDTRLLAWDQRMLALHGLGTDGDGSGADGDGDGPARLLPAGSSSRVLPAPREVLERVVHPDDLPALARALERARSSLGELNVEYRVLLPSGQVRWITTRGRVVPDLLGRPGRILGAAFDRSRERALADELAATGDRLQVLASAGAALGATLSPHAVLDVLVDVLVPSQAATLVVAVTPEVAELLGYGYTASRTDLHPARLRHADPALQPTLEAVIAGAPLSVEAASGVGLAVRTGQSQRLERVPEDVLRSRATSPEHLELMRGLNMGASLSVPLRTPRGTSGALTVTAGPGQDLDDLLVTDIARRAAVALENALDHARTSRVTRDLQAALLPPQAGGVPGVALASRYLPAASGALAGGDFFSTLAVGGQLVLALGDVMGHGAVSAARAGQLHALVSVLALRGLAPGELLGCLATDVGQVMDLELATLLVCSYDPASRELRAASAGHPPPLLAGPSGARYLDVEPGPPVGVAVGRYREQAVALPAGDVAVLFSDGLVERRDRSLQDGLDRLQAALADLARTERGPVGGGRTSWPAPAPGPAGRSAGQESLSRVEALAHGALHAMDCADGAADDVALLVLEHPSP